MKEYYKDCHPSPSGCAAYERIPSPDSEFFCFFWEVVWCILGATIVSGALNCAGGQVPDGISDGIFQALAKKGGQVFL